MTSWITVSIHRAPRILALAAAAAAAIGAALAAGPPLDESAPAFPPRCLTAVSPSAPVGDTGGAPAMLLAEVYAGGIDLTGYWISEKLDGVRARWDGEHLISRGGQRIAAPDWFAADFPRLPLDGELWMGRGTFERLSGTVRRAQPDAAAWRAVRFMLFDLLGCDAPFGQRLAALRELLAQSASPYLALIEQTRGSDAADLQRRLDAVTAAGGEGLMLHRDASRARAGRSRDLLKVKPYLDAEARVVAHLPGRGQYAGLLGALAVEMADGRRFRIGTGFSLAERRAPPPIGSLVTYRYRGLTARGLPRFASFLRVRDDP